MKLYTNHKFSIMKNVFMICLLLSFFSSRAQMAQKRSSIADPMLGQAVLTDMAGRNLDPAGLQENQAIRLRIPVSNNSMVNKIPVGSTKIRIGLGSKIRLVQGSIVDAPGLDNYFTWTAAMAGGQQEMIGVLKNELPADFHDITVAFKVKGITVGRSTITGNFLVSNQENVTILSDANPDNNTTYLSYTINAKAEAKSLISINNIARVACSINLNFSNNKEVNLDKYEIETSKDGSTYVKVGEVKAADKTAYASNFALSSAVESKNIWVRVKATDMSGAIIYSQAVTVEGSCDNGPAWVLSVYPNPATSDMKAVTISTVLGKFSGKYKLTLVDLAGHLVQVREVILNNVTSLRYDFGNIAAGKYMIQITNTNGTQAGLLHFERLR